MQKRLYCSYANRYDDEAVASPFVRFTDLLRCSFHFQFFECDAVLRIIKDRAKELGEI